MTHKELMHIAYKWVLKNGSVGFAFKELKSISDEIPDVIGFGGWESVLIECKVSRSDFFSDKNKPHRAKGMGNWRFYCCPKGLIKVSELPEKWGLIYVNEKGKARVEFDCRVKKVRYECTDDWEKKIYPEGFYIRAEHTDENKFDVDMISERNIMYTALRRLFIKGYMKFIYDQQYQKGIKPAELIALNEFPAIPETESIKF